MVPLVFLLSSCAGSLVVSHIMDTFSRRQVTNGCIILIVFPFVVLTVIAFSDDSYLTYTLIYLN